MVKINKKGYMQTLEAVIALIILFGVILFSISLRQPDVVEVPEDIRLTQEAILSGVEYNQNFRDSFFNGSLGTLTSNFMVKASFLV